VAGRPVSGMVGPCTSTLADKGAITDCLSIVISRTCVQIN
jgi:hypothetical protein